MRSIDPENWDVVEDTTIQGSGDNKIPVVRFNNNPNSVLTGFTLTNGDDGVRCSNSSSPEIINCIIKDSDYCGIYCESDSSIKVKNSKIISNGIASNYDGIYCEGNSAPNIVDCLIEDNGKNGISCSSNSDVNIINCIIKGNGTDGINCRFSSFMVSNCIIEDNNGSGIYTYKASSSAIVANNIICKNGGYGIHYDSIYQAMVTEEIKNNWIHNNGSGIYIDEVDEPVTIRNNTIADNNGYGIHSYNSVYEVNPDINNCIIWANNDGQLYSNHPPFDNVTYSCIQDGYDGEGNIEADPCFVDDVNNNYHLSADSNCIDAGNPNFVPDPNETDIDGEPRVIDGDANGTDIVDMGADEFYWSPADFDRDEIVNFIDYAVLAAAWQTEDPNISLDDDNDVDIYDLAIFCDHWLWESAWKQSDPLRMMGAGCGQGSSFTEDIYTEQLEAEPQPQLTEQDIQEQLEMMDQLLLEYMMDWLEELLADEQLREAMGQDQWQKWIEIIEEFIEELKGRISAN